MAQLSEHHRTLTNGIGKCSVPMWAGGCPAGFCDEPAYGPQEEGQRRYGDYKMEGGFRKWYSHYCSGLACYVHGGPKQPPVAPGEQPPSRPGQRHGLPNHMGVAGVGDFCCESNCWCGGMPPPAPPAQERERDEIAWRILDDVFRESKHFERELWRDDAKKFSGWITDALATAAKLAREEALETMIEAIVFIDMILPEDEKRALEAIEDAVATLRPFAAAQPEQQTKEEGK